jgi:hypothetical protein
MTNYTAADIVSLANADSITMKNKTTIITDSNDAATKEIETKNNTLIQKQQIQDSQLKEIENKEKLLLTRARMLQISQDRNSYKTKIIYTLLAILIVIFIINLFIWSLKKSNVNVK